MAAQKSQLSPSDENIKGAGAYLLGPATGIALLLIEKKSDYVRFHAMQSTLVFGALLLLSVVLEIIPILGWLIAVLISPVFSLVAFILWIFLMWKAFSGERYKLVYFGDLAERYLRKLG